MAGTFIAGVSEILSGVYTLIKAAVSRIIMGTRGIVAYPFAADWGPVNSLQNIASQADFKSLYNGAVSTLSAKKIYTHAFKGKPKSVLSYRMATNAAAKGTVTLNDSEAAKSLELETLYPSARAFTAVVSDGTSGGKVVDIIEAGVKLCSFEAATVADLEALINASDFVRVKSKGANVPANTAGAAFAGGNNGSVVTATEYSAFLDAIEADLTANAFALDGVTDEAILTVAETFVKRVRGEGFYVSWVRGGALAWDSSIASANTKSKALNHRAIVNVGNGCDGYSGAEMAIFIAARVASVALNATLTDEVVDYAAVNKKLKTGERKVAKQSGTLVFVQVGGNVVIDEGVNTMTAPPAGEVKEFGKIRINNALDYIAKDLEAFGDEYKKSRSNTPEARETYAATVETDYLAPLAAMDVILPGFFYKPDPDYYGKDATKKAEIDEAFFYSDITPVDSMERIYQTINVNF